MTTLAILCVAVALQGERFDALHATIDLAHEASVLTHVQRSPEGPRGQHFAEWTAQIDTSKVVIDLVALGREQFTRFTAPGDVVDVLGWNRANRDREAKRAAVFSYDEDRPVAGALGYVPYGWVGIAEEKEGTKPVATILDFGVLTQEYGWAFQVDARPALSAEEVDALVATLAAAVTYDGPQMVPEWTDEEVLERWEADAPDDVQEDRDLEVVRTDQYLIMTVTGKGTARQFGKQLDENYEFIRSIYPFEDVEGQRLLPVYYFLEKPEYVDFLVKKIGWTAEEAARSGGVASGDWYATYHQARTAPVHVHEATHQIFGNRLMLSGGGSWFQEGVAEYISSKANELNPIERLAKKGEHTPFRTFMTVPSLLMSNEGSRKEGGSNAGLAYSQAAAIIEFVRHSKETRENFLDWMHAIGRTSRGDLPAIERATVQTLGMNIDELEASWREYYSNRKKVRDWHDPAEKLVR